ncbi:hypothetical protein Drose_18510 [Dactylosporangium roseum]|uniref:Uncharacterized protein n=1 Tax=Dactylosporangium roseum TaxID=47989 RepID=A0ABY5ZGY6_9ACTN|nr:hypothetical protein [Dactylosporangium roseum]UWZ40017.1 hypothetical protein Drose_18510 [Dactylosporangium roseum]
MPHTTAVRLQVAQLLATLEQASTVLAGEPRADPDRLAAELDTILRRAYDAATHIAAYLDERSRAATEPGS